MSRCSRGQGLMFQGCGLGKTKTTRTKKTIPKKLKEPKPKKKHSQRSLTPTVTGEWFFCCFFCFFGFGSFGFFGIGFFGSGGFGYFGALVLHLLESM